MKPAKSGQKKSPVRKKAAPRKPRTTAAKQPAAESHLLKLLVQALDAKKAEDIRVLQVKELSSITDYLVLATATSDPHQRALRIELEKVLDAEKARILGIDTSKGSGWTVVDAFDVMIHLFTPDNRKKYRLDLLWNDAEEIPLRALLAK
jgi:ribosome-associated protein